MILLYALIVLIATALAVDYTSGVRVSVSAHVAHDTADIGISRLRVNIAIRMDGGVPLMEIRFLNHKMVKRQLVVERGGKKLFDVKRFLKALQVSRLSAEGSYAMSDPFLTGVSYAALNAAGALIRPGDIRLAPDFTSDDAFVDVSAHANVSLSHTIYNYLTRRTAKWNKT